jgi:outer membrane protein assembly factor BamB
MTNMRPIKILTMVKMAFIMCLIFSVQLNAQNWPMVNGGRERTSWAKMEDELLPPLDKRMEFSLNGTASGISFYENMLFVSSEGEPNKITAFNAQNGNELWHFDIPNTRALVGLVPGINDSLVLCGGQHGLGLYALDRLTGMEKWFKSIGSLFSRNPIIDSNRVYIVGDSLYCLNIGDGSTIWSFSFSENVSPVVDEEKVYICGDRKLIALNKMNGDSVWQMDNSQRYYSSISVDDKYVYTYNHDSIVALEKDSAGLEWSYGIPDGELADLSTNAMAISDGFLCFSVWTDSNDKGLLYTLDKATGNYLWHYTFDTTGVFSPAIANGIVYVVKWESYSLWGFDLNTGLKVFCDSSEKYYEQPIVADGKLFVGTFGKVVTFENYGTGINTMPKGGQKSPELLQTWPNPFKESTSFQFHLAQSDYLNISVYDLAGKRVKTLSDKKFAAGSYNLTWDATNDGNLKVPSGIYILKLTSKHHILLNRMILLK